MEEITEIKGGMKMGVYFSFGNILNKKQLKNINSPYKYNIVFAFGSNNKQDLIKTMIGVKDVIKRKLKEERKNAK